VDYRLLAIFANVFANQLGLPVPVIPTLVVAGALAFHGNLSPTAFLVGAVSACLCADSVWFLAGRIYGSGVMKLLCRLSLTPDSCVSNTQARFERLGINAVLISKFVPGLSLIAPPLAGAIRMSWLRFLAFDAISSAAWVILAATAGAAFHRQIEQLTPFVMAYRVEAVVALCVLLVGYVAYKWWDRVRFFSTLRMARIEAGELHGLISSGAAPLIVDVRSVTAVALEPRSIPGALRVPLNEVRDRLLGTPREREIVAYCTCPNEVSAAEVAKILMDSGFRRVRPLRGGLDAWIAAGYAVEPVSNAELVAPSAAIDFNA
jgi:membrane protein DedA with SNARE-associated domain/rhodanese-related sulfurtransferase